MLTWFSWRGIGLRYDVSIMRPRTVCQLVGVLRPRVFFGKQLSGWMWTGVEVRGFAQVFRGELVAAVRGRDADRRGTVLPVADLGRFCTGFVGFGDCGRERVCITMVTHSRYFFA